MPNEKQENNQATLERAKNKGAEGEDAQGSGELLPENEGAKKKAGWQGKKRPVSFSSQDSNSQDDLGSRKSTRKQTAVFELGAEMIDSKTRDEREEEPLWKGRDNA